MSTTYDDAIVKKFITGTVLGGAIGMLVGVILALQLAWWPANLGLPYTSFGRLRPQHSKLLTHVRLLFHQNQTSVMLPRCAFTTNNE